MSYRAICEIRHSNTAVTLLENDDDKTATFREARIIKESASK